MGPRPHQIFRAFFFLGLTSFGGPAAGLGTLEAEFARRRRWVSESRARELLTWSKLLPGPVVTQFAILLGHEMGGSRKAGFLAGLGFVLPAVGIVAGLSVLGRAFERMPMVQGALEAGILGALGVVALSVLDLSRGQLRTRFRWAAFLAALILAGLWPAGEPLFLLGGGLWGALREPAGEATPAAQSPARGSFPWVLLALGVAFATVLLFPAHSLGGLGSGGGAVFSVFQSCLRAAALTFGTGMAVLPVLKQAFVEGHHWISAQDFSLALALGQVTPGPMVITAAALGFLAQGWVGFLAGAVGIFLPSFFNSLAILPEVRARVRSPDRMRAFVDGAFPWVLGALAGAGVGLALQVLRPAGATTASMILRATSFLLIVGVSRRWKIPSWAVILGSAGGGLVLSLVRG